MMTTLRAIIGSRSFRLAVAAGLITGGLDTIMGIVEQLREDVSRLIVDTAAVGVTLRTQAAPVRTGHDPYPAEEDLAPLHTTAPNGFEAVTTVGPLLDDVE